MTLFGSAVRTHRRRTGRDFDKIATSAAVNPARLWRIEEGLEVPEGKEARRIMIATRIPDSRARFIEWVTQGDTHV